MFKIKYYWRYYELFRNHTTYQTANCKSAHFSETAKYYALIHHNKFEETLNAFNQNVETEHQWVEDHKAILGTTPEFATYYEVIQQLHIHPFDCYSR